ncbi:radical SAM protein [Peptoniphilus stercorisuis]|uniref:Pyruvate formate lyase activating enzyme n=1 Tax=Peptoniphilus stercorisuis TaxID=1436965 RepID=A0ABS4KDL6_9FIRM|nr:radical SAM protein [Peptoniphilus stercorisuis]MBP2025868.1 putative pyruvate formate lyase activating enzyme [Peptoniphilus stercorisuis]
MEKFIEYENCNICPRNCNINRYKSVGYCKMPAQLYASRASIHMWEEPPISGENGSGTVFFTGCNLKCIYCQNYEIALGSYGEEINSEKLADIYLNLQKNNVHNINLVTPSHYIPTIRKSLIIAKKMGLNIPVVYNTSSYDNVDSLKTLRGLVDIYLADFKYFNDDISKKYSNAKDYVEVAKSAIKEMYNQVGINQFDENEMMKSGVIVRHLMLPDHLEDSKKIVKYLYSEYKDNIYLSLMNQFTPVRKVKYENLNKKISIKDYDKLIDYAISLGVENAFIQEGDTVDESFIPSFNLSGIKDNKILKSND